MYGHGDKSRYKSSMSLLVITINGVCMQNIPYQCISLHERFCLGWPNPVWDTKCMDTWTKLGTKGVCPYR